MNEHREIAIFSLLDTPAFGGAEQYLFSHLHFLSLQGYNVILATNNKDVKREILSRLKEDDMKTFQIINAPYRLDAIGNWKGLIKFFLSLPKAILWLTISIRQLKKKYKKVICLWPGFSDRLIFSPIAFLYNTSLIWIEIGPLDPTFKRNFGFPKLLYRFAERFPSHIITTSLFTKSSIIKNSHFTSKEITLIYPGTKMFSKNEINIYRQKVKKISASQKTMSIGVIARLADENEVDVVILAFHLYLKNYSEQNIKLLIIGDGHKNKELKNLTQRLKIQNQVIFYGFVTEERKRIILANCDFFIFPRAWELDGFGITTIEAMSLGLPVLTTDFGPQIEIVTDGKEGYRYKPHDMLDLSLKIARMANLNSLELKNMSKEAIKRAKDFSDILSNKKMFEVVKSQMRKKP